MLPFSFPCLVARQICLGHLPPQIWIESHSNVNLYPVFYLKAYLRCTESFRMKPDGAHVSSLFLGNNRQHQPVCRLSLGGCCFCSLSRQCFPGDHPAGQVSGPEFIHWLGTISLPTLLLWISTRTLHSMLCGASVSRSSPVKVSNIDFYSVLHMLGCWAIALPSIEQIVPQLSKEYYH